MPNDKVKVIENWKSVEGGDLSELMVMIVVNWRLAIRLVNWNVIVICVVSDQATC